MSTGLKSQATTEQSERDDKRLKLGLALSGGGFRATLFHVGVLKCLSDAGLLKHVSHVTSVSGGSILAAHLFENWNLYLTDFAKASEPLLEFVQYDIRGRILRRFPYSFFYRRWRRTHLLQNYYHRLFLPKLSEAVAPVDENLPPRPHLGILATNLNTGSMYAFSEQYVYVVSRGEMKALRTDLPLTSLKVAISSAFPAFFPPITLTHRDVALDVAEFEESQCFTDGGIFDNLGIRFFQRAYELHDRDKTHGRSAASSNYFWHDVPTTVLASNASSAFDVQHGTGTLFSTALRAVDILMNRIGVMDVESIIGAPGANSDKFRYLGLDAIVKSEEDKHCLNVALQKAIRFMRTDLDAFSRLECSCLIQHGYCVARQQLREIQNEMVLPPGEPSEDLDRAISAVEHRDPWDPFADDPSSPLQKPLLGEAPTEATTVIVEKQCRKLHKGARSRLRFFSFRDPIPTLMNSAILLAIAAVIALVSWREYSRPDEGHWLDDPVLARIAETHDLRVGVADMPELGFLKYDTSVDGSFSVKGLDMLLVKQIRADLWKWLGDDFKLNPRPSHPIRFEWEQLLQGPRQNKVDIIISSISFTADRKKEYGLRFSVPYHSTSVSLLGHSKDVDAFQDHSTDRTVVVFAGSTAADLARRMQPDLHWVVLECANIDEVREKFAALPEAYALADTPMVDSWQQHWQDGPVHQKELRPADFPISVPPERRKEYYVIGVTEDSARLAWAIDGILMQLAKDGRLEQMIEQSRGEYEKYKTQSQTTASPEVN